MAALLLHVRLRHDLRRQVQPLPQVVEALGSQGVVVPLPAELGLEEAARGERLAGLDDIEVLGVDFVVLGEVEVLLRDEHALAEEVLVDELAVGLGDQHLGGVDAVCSVRVGGWQVGSVGGRRLKLKLARCSAVNVRASEWLGTLGTGVRIYSGADTHLEFGT